MNDMRADGCGRRASPFCTPQRCGARVLHGRAASGIVRRIVQTGAHNWPRRPLPEVGAAVARPPAHAASQHDGGVVLWLARLDDFSADAPVEADAARAASISDPAVRRRFAVSRMLLRRVLAALTGCAADGSLLAVAAHGKPVLADAGAAARCHFNLTHSGGWWLLATAASPVGVDLEMAGRTVDAARVAARVFTPGERAALQLAAGDEAAMRAVFLDCWTRKEALLKAIGTGFAGGAQAFHVGPGPGDTIVPVPGGAPAALRVRSLALPFAAHAAIACAPSVACFERVRLQGDAG